MDEFRFLDLEARTAYENMAVDEAILLSIRFLSETVSPRLMDSSLAEYLVPTQVYLILSDSGTTDKPQPARSLIGSPESTTSCASNRGPIKRTVVREVCPGIDRAASSSIRFPRK